MKRVPGDQLTTTEAAELLHCSRQHVADLCDRGELPHTMTGRHRRIPRQAIERLLQPPPIRREDEKSLWLNLAVVGKLVADPARVLDIAWRNLELHDQTGTPRGQLWRERWQRTLDHGIPAVVVALTARTPTAGELRQTGPFAGVLTEEERHAVLEAFNTYWRQRRTAA